MDPAEGLRIHLFGVPWCILDGVPVDLPSGKPTLLLTVFALEAGRAVRTTEVIDALWPENPPRSARPLVHTYVSTLRAALGGASVLQTVQGGYRLACARDSVDVHQVLAASSSEDTTIWQCALSVSSEPILSGQDLPLILSWQRRVDDARDGLQLRWWADRVDNGEAATVLPQVQEGVRADPLREDKVRLLARALGAVGRSDEGIAALDALRLRLARELGTDPSPGHDDLRGQLLARDHVKPVSTGQIADQFEPRLSANLPRSPDPTHQRVATGTGRRLRLLVGGSAVVLLLFVLLFSWLQRPVMQPPTEVAGPALVEVDPAHGITSATELPLDPDEVHADSSTAWVISSRARALASVGLDASRDVNVVGLPDTPVSLAVQDDIPTIALGFSGTVVTVNRGRVGAPFQPVADWNGKLVVSAGTRAPWFATATGDVHAPPSTPGWSGPVRLPSQPSQIAADGSTVWALTTDALVMSAGSGAPVVSALRGVPEDLTASDGQAWVITSGDNRIWRADSDTHRIVQTTTLPGHPVAVAADRTVVWVALVDPPSLIQLDPQNMQAGTPLVLPGPPVDLALRDGDLIVAVRAPSQDLTMSME